MTTYVDKIVERFGGTRPMAAAIGKAPSTVQSWKTRGYIPDHEKATIIEIAKHRRLGLKAIDYLPLAT